MGVRKAGFDCIYIATEVSYSQTHALQHQLNPLSPNSDQDQISPNNIHTLSRDKL